MPITFPAHPLLVVPLKKYLRLPLDGLALFVGAMSPDFSYIFILDRDIFHTGWQAFALGLPLALLFYYWIGCIMLPVWKSLFDSIGWIDVQKLATPVKSSFIWVVISLLLGIFTHLLLDGVTHHNFWPGSLYISQGVAFTLGSLAVTGQMIAWWGVSTIFSFGMWAVAYHLWPHSTILQVKRVKALVVMICVHALLFALWYYIMEEKVNAPTQGRLPRSFSMGVIALFSVMWGLLKQPKAETV